MDRGPGKPNQDERRDQKQELTHQRERQSYGFRQHPHDEVHAQMPPRPRHCAATHEHAADHEKQHAFFAPRERSVQEITADDVCKVERDAADQQ